MSTIHIDAQVSAEELLKAVEQLPAPELERLRKHLLAVRAKQIAPCLSAKESALLLQINQGLPDTLRQPYGHLIAKRRAASLTAEEHAELLRLTDEVENLEALRVKALAELAQLRGTTLSALLIELGIQTPAHE